MALRGKSPESIQKRLKALFYGNAGVGKTTAAIQFPAPYLIDTEKGAENDQYVKQLKSSGGVIFQTSDFEDMVNEIRSLLKEKHEFKTLIIDPLTTVYNDLLDKAAIKVGTSFGAHYNEANKGMKHLINLLLRLDMNVIITAHSKNEYGEGLVVLGQTFDCWKKLDYLFDLVFLIQKRGKDRIGVVKKSRVEVFTDGEQFPFSYDSIADKYGRDILEKESIAQELATREQIDEVNNLIELMKIPDDIIDKWLNKEKAENWEEMPKETLQKCIDMLNKKLTDRSNKS